MAGTDFGQPTGRQLRGEAQPESPEDRAVVEASGDGDVAAPGDAAPAYQRFNVLEILAPVIERNARQLPKLIGGAIKLVWSAAHRELALATGLQVLASL